MKNVQIFKDKNDHAYEKWKNNRQVPSNKYEIEHKGNWIKRTTRNCKTKNNAWLLIKLNNWLLKWWWLDESHNHQQAIRAPHTVFINDTSQSYKTK